MEVVMATKRTYPVTYNGLILIIINIIGKVEAVQTWIYDEATSDPNISNTCEAFCDRNGLQHPPRRCLQDGEHCCGTHTFRFCCSDKSKAINLPGETCQNDHWQFYQRLIIGMLLSLITLLVLMICFFYCCSSEAYIASRRRRRRQREIAEMNAAAAQDGVTTIPVQFDPESPYAFQPPEYDSLPKDPPLYLDVFGAECSDNAQEAHSTDTTLDTVDAGAVNTAGEAETGNTDGSDNRGFSPDRHMQSASVLTPVEETSAFSELEYSSPSLPSSKSLPVDGAAAVAALKHGKYNGKSSQASASASQQHEQSRQGVDKDDIQVAVCDNSPDIHANRRCNQRDSHNNA